MHDNKIFITIGILADILKISQRTLRIYDKEGILCPKRSERNRRYYSLDDIEKAKLILFLTKNLALNLMGVKIIISLLENEKPNIKVSLNTLKKL